MKSFILSILALAALTSCEKTQENAEPTIPTGPQEIKLTAGVTTVDAVSKSIITGEKFTTDTEIGLYAIEKGDTDYAWGTDLTYNNDGTATIDAVSQNIGIKKNSANFKIYYPTNDKNVQFFAYFPKETAESQLTKPTVGTAPSVTYTIDGQTDILYANVESGTLSSHTTDAALVFNHKLAKIGFTVVAGEGFSGSANVTAITLTGTHNQFSLNIGSGTLTSTGNTFDLTAYSDATGTPITTTATGAIGIILIEPGATYGLTITAGGVDYTVSNLKAPVAGKQQTVALTFKGTEIVAKTSIKDWETDSDASNSGDVQK